jgi:hypothetical protein|tara:strand:+ start:37958 stop:38176 length:219 start_codon:yes stop_codon:yes gene_type:complete
MASLIVIHVGSCFLKFKKSLGFKASIKFIALLSIGVVLQRLKLLNYKAGCTYQTVAIRLPGRSAVDEFFPFN